MAKLRCKAQLQDMQQTWEYKRRKAHNHSPCVHWKGGNARGVILRETMLSSTELVCPLKKGKGLSLSALRWWKRWNEPHTCSPLVTVTALIENVLCVKNLFVSSAGPQREPSVRAINDLDQQHSPRSSAGSADERNTETYQFSSNFLRWHYRQQPFTLSLPASLTMCNISLSIILTAW